MKLFPRAITSRLKKEKGRKQVRKVRGEFAVREKVTNKREKRETDKEVKESRERKVNSTKRWV